MIKLTITAIFTLVSFSAFGIGTQGGGFDMLKAKPDSNSAYPLHGLKIGKPLGGAVVYEEVSPFNLQINENVDVDVDPLKNISNIDMIALKLASGDYDLASQITGKVQNKHGIVELNNTVIDLSAFKGNSSYSALTVGVSFLSRENLITDDEATSAISEIVPLSIDDLRLEDIFEAAKLKPKK